MGPLPKELKGGIPLEGPLLEAWVTNWNQFVDYWNIHERDSSLRLPSCGDWVDASPVAPLRPFSPILILSLTRAPATIWIRSRGWSLFPAKYGMAHIRMGIELDKIVWAAWRPRWNEPLEELPFPVGQDWSRRPDTAD